MAQVDDARLVDVLAEVVADSDTKAVFRRLLQQALQELIEAELTAVIGAAPHERTELRTNQRNGGRDRLLSTPAGDVELRIPKVKTGSFFRRCWSRADGWTGRPRPVIMTAYVHGTSTRKVDDLVRALGCDSGISKSTVSRICADIDADVSAFRQRRLDHVGFPYVFCDATTYVKARVDGRVASRAVVAPPASPPTAPARSSASMWATAGMRCSGPRFCVPCVPAAWPV